MGGRGRNSGVGNRQLTIANAQRQNQIFDIIQKSSKLREKISEAKGIEGNSTATQFLKKCVCCREYTLPFPSEYEVCLICGWINDEVQNQHPDSLRGKNPISLRKAQEIYCRKEEA